MAQLGLFLLLASRFWQRGIEAALVMSADPPIVAGEEIAAMVEEEEDIPVAATADSLAGLSEPTLRELVQKLSTEPWANPDAAGPAVPLRPSLDSTPAAAPPRADEPQTSVFERHATKFPLGGVSPEDKPEKPIEKADAPGGPEKPPRK